MNEKQIINTLSKFINDEQQFEIWVKERQSWRDRRKWLEYTSFFLGIVFMVYLLIMIIKFGISIYSDLQYKEPIKFEKSIKYTSIDTSKKEIIIQDDNVNGHDSINTTIDLINLLIVGGGVLFAIMTLLVTLKLRDWEKNSIDISKQYDDLKMQTEEIISSTTESKKYIQELNEEKTKFNNEVKKIQATDEITQEISMQLIFTKEFYSRYARGLSKFYAHNYVDAIIEFKNLADLVISKNKESELDDVYFHIGRAYFKRIDFTKNELDKMRIEYLIEAIKYFDLAFNMYNDDNLNNKLHAMAYKALSLAYLTNPMRTANTLKTIEDYRKDSEESIEIVMNNISRNIKNTAYYAAASYNVACAYAVLYKYKKNKLSYKEHAINILRLLYIDKGYINKDYIINEQDLSAFIDYSSSSEDRKEIIKIVEDFFSKKNSRWLIAKLCMDLYEITNNNKIKRRALDLIIRCIKTRLISVEQLLESTTFNELSKLWKKEICVEVLNNIDKYKIFVTKEYKEKLIEKTKM